MISKENIKKEVLLFACIEKNIGDDLFIHTMCERYPNCIFLISSDAKYGSLKLIKNLKFSRVLKAWTFFNKLQPKNKLRYYIKKIIERLLVFCMRKHKYGAMIVGNAFKNYDYKGRQQIEWLRERNNLVENFFLISTNFGPYYNEQWRLDCKDVFAEISDVCFRDVKSFSAFHELPNVRVAPDAILSIGKRKHSEKTRRLVLISIIDCNFPGRDSWIHNCSDMFEHCIVKIVDRYITKGYNVIILNSNAEQDRPAAERIQQMSANGNLVDIYDYNGDIYDLLPLFEQAEFVIGTRLHTIILAFLYEIPVLPIVYDIKVEGVLESCLFSEDYINIDECDNLDIELIEQALLNYEYSLSNEIITKAQEQFLMLDRILMRDGNE